MITIFYIIETILIYFYSLGFSLNARPHKRQCFNHHRVEIKVVVVAVVVHSIQIALCVLLWSTVSVLNGYLELRILNVFFSTYSTLNLLYVG